MRSPIVLAFALLAAAGCRKKDGDVEARPPASGRPEWAVTGVTLLEGRSTSVTLKLSRAPVAEPAEVQLQSSDDSQVSVASSVTFAIGETSKSISIVAVADDVDPGVPIHITASNNTGSSTLSVAVIEDDATLGAANDPVAVSTGTAVLVGAGADGVFQTGEEELVVATGIGTGVPTLTRVALGFSRSTEANLPVPLGDGAHVLVLSSGGPADILLQFGGLPAVPSLSDSLTLVGASGSAQRPVLVGTSAVVASLGVDGITSADDVLFVIRGLGTTTLTSTTVSVPGLAAGGPSAPVPHDATSLLLSSAGPDFTFGTGDEVLTLVHSLDTTPTVVPLFSGRIRGDDIGRAISAGPTTAAVLLAGVDTTFGTADDELQVVRNILAGPVPAPPLVVGAVSSDAGARAVATGADAALIPLLGVDLAPGTADDEIGIATSLSLDPIGFSSVVVPQPVPGSLGRLLVLSPSTAVRLTTGADGTLGTSDDALLVLRDLSGTPALGSASPGALAPFAPMPFGGDDIALVGEGPDSVSGTSDDLVFGILDVSTVATVTSAGSGPFALLGPPALVQTGGDPAIAGRSAGPDAASLTADDLLSVTSLP